MRRSARDATRTMCSPVTLGIGPQLRRDALQDFAASQREVPGTKFASEYTSPSGHKYYSTNPHGTAGELENMPELQDAVSAAGHHGGCAEVGCLIQGYAAEGPSAISGGTMRIVNLRNPMSSRAAEQGTPAYPRGRCQRLLDGLGIGSGSRCLVVLYSFSPRYRKSSKPQAGRLIR
jgi:hypothetical protein